MAEEDKFKKIHVRVSADAAKELKKMAEAEGLSPYAYGGYLLERAVIYEHKSVSDQLLAPHIRAAVREELHSMMESMMQMLTRTYLEAGTGRRLIQTNLTLLPEMSREDVIELQKRNWDNAQKQLREDIQGVGDWRRLLVDNPLKDLPENEEE